MPRQHKERSEHGFERLAHLLTRWTGSTAAFMAALSVIIVWGITGPLFGYSDTWQLVINTGTTVVTFLMVFLIQRTQNKDSLALHLKLNELVAATLGASNRLVNVEDLSEEELQVFHRHFEALSTMAKRSADLGESHSMEEAEHRHEEKRHARASSPAVESRSRAAAFAREGAPSEAALPAHHGSVK